MITIKILKTIRYVVTKAFVAIMTEILIVTSTNAPRLLRSLKKKIKHYKI